MGEVSNRGLQSVGFDLTQFYGVFFEEAGENLANMENLLLAIDVDAASDEELAAIFRVAHSIKGGAATFGFSDVAELTHELETLLDRLRKSELKLRRDMVDVLLEAGDVLKAQLARYQGTAEESPDTTDLVARIRKLAAGEALAPAAGLRTLRVRVGPLADGAAADGLVELFRDIPTLGSISALDGSVTSADGYREFRVDTASADNELIELFSFHVGKDQIRISDFAETARADAADGRALEPVVEVLLEHALAMRLDVEPERFHVGDLVL